MEPLLDTPGIAGTGVGLNAAGKPVIRIYAERPDVAGIPAALEGVGVERVITGILGIRAPTDRFPRPVPIGVSSGHLNTATGTLGARVTDGTNVYALSNNHVYAASNSASVGDGIIQPGNVDGGSDPADRIGTLHTFQSINFTDGTTNTMDAAIALTSVGNVGTSTPPEGYGTPSTVPATAFVGQAVQKFGRTTGFQLGSVAEINVSVDVCYVFFFGICFEDARFVNQVAVTPDAFSAGGDSGSLIVTQDGNRPVALLFAGGEGRTIGNPIDLVLQRFGVTIDGTPPLDGPPAAPTSLTALAGDGSVSLSWVAPSFDGGSPITNYAIYRGEGGGAKTLLASVGTETSYTDSSAQNGTTYAYEVAAVNALGEGARSSAASATPMQAIAPAEPLSTVDDFNRADESPLSDGGRWSNGVNGTNGEVGLQVSSNLLACNKSTTCTAWRSNTQYGPDTEVWTTVGTLAGTNNHIRLNARLQQVGTAGYDGYMLRTNELSGPDEIFLERLDNGAFVRLLTVNHDLAVGDRLLLRAEGSTLEAWLERGSVWSRLGTVVDSTYSAAGYVGIALRGTTGRLDDFGARTTIPNLPDAPTNLSALAGDGSVSLSWVAPSFDGGSPITSYAIYRGEGGGAKTLLASVGTETSYTDSSAQNGTTYAYEVAAVNALGEGPRSNEAQATPTQAIAPAEPLSALDDFNRPDETLSDAGRWSNGIVGTIETGLSVTSSQLACSRTTTCTAWRNTGVFGPDSEVWATIATLPGNGNGVRLYLRIQSPGVSGADGYYLYPEQLSGTDQVSIYRMTNSSLAKLASFPLELAAGDTLLLRAAGSTLEAWHRDGSGWSRLGQVNDSTYLSAGYAGIGIRGVSGRVDDVGVRTMGVLPPPLAITTSSLPGGTAGQPYSQNVTASGGQTPYSWSLASGSLPPGLTLTSGTPSATISGTPTAGTYAFTLEVTDGAQSATQALSITVGAALTIDTTSLPGGTAGQPYSQTVTASGGQTPYSWSLASGSLPPGLTLTSGTPSATISGIPTTAGSYVLTLEVTDGDQTATQAYSIVVAEDPSVAAVESVTYATEGGRASNQHLVVRVRIVAGGAPVANASVTINLLLDGAVYATSTATTGTDGLAAFKFTNYQAGCYTTVVTQLTVGGATSTPSTPANSHCK